MTPEQIRAGEIGNKLTKEDFETALQVFKLVGEHFPLVYTPKYVILSLPRVVKTSQLFKKLLHTFLRLYTMCACWKRPQYQCYMNA